MTRRGRVRDSGEPQHDADCDMRPFEQHFEREQGMEARGRVVNHGATPDRVAGANPIQVNKRVCISRAGVIRWRHEWDKDGQCLFCDRAKIKKGQPGQGEYAP